VHTSRFKVLIFDFDYTLFDTSAGVIECMQRAFAALDQEIPADASIRTTIGLPLPGAVSSLNAALSKSQVDEIAQHFLRFADVYMVERTFPIPPVPRLLPELVSEGFYLALLTGKYRARVVRTLEAHGLLGCFDSILCGDEVRGKPDPEGLTRICEKWGSHAREEFVFVGDHYLDILTAKNGGIDCIAVSSGQTSPEVLASYKPLAVIPGLESLRAVLSGSSPAQRASGLLQGATSL
jgi:phosphoglycolate phosphatase